MRNWSRQKVKVTRSKVKVKFAIIWKNCLGYKSGTDDCIFIKLILRIHIHATLKVTKGQGHKVKGQGQICRHVKITVWAINHERLIGSWSNLYTGLTLMQHWRWHKFKVTRSKVKVKYTVIWKNCLGYTSIMNDWIFIKLIHLIDFNAMLKVTQGQGLEVKGQGQ